MTGAGARARWADVTVGGSGSARAMADKLAASFALIGTQERATQEGKYSKSELKHRRVYVPQIPKLTRMLLGLQGVETRD